MNSDLKNDLDDLKNDLETRLLNLIRVNSELTYKVLGEYLGVSETTVKRALTKLKQEGKRENI